jgi:PAS domain S-box-containing protein
MTAQRADGSKFPAEFTLTRSESIDPPVYTLFIRDIARRKHAEAQIATLVQAVESTGEMICITDLADRFIFANRAFLETYRYEEAELLGLTPAVLFSPNNPPSLLPEILVQTRAGGWKGEVLDLRKDGTEFPIFLSTSLVRDQSGQVIGLMGVAQDISERKRTEEQFRLLGHAVQSAQEMISITDPENRFTFVNDAFLEAYGYTRLEVLGQTPHFLYAAENPPGLCEEIHEETTRGGWRGELVNRTKDGWTFPISLSTSQIKSLDGKVLGLAGFARDISERRRMERQTAVFAALGHELSAAATPQQAAEIILESAAKLFGWEAGYVHLLSEHDGLIIPVLTLDTIDGKRVHVPASNFTLEPSALMRRVMKEGAQLVNRAEGPEVPVKLEAFGDKSRPSSSMMYVPIPAKATVLGVLSIQSYRPRAYGPGDLAILQSLADYCGSALQRIRATEALREAEANYRGIFENVTEGIFRTTPAGRFLSANPAAARMLGYESPEALIETVTDIAQQTYVIPEQRQELRKVLETRGSMQGFEVQRYRKDRSIFWTSISARTVCDENGQILYFEGTYQDITERKFVESGLRDSEQRFRTLFESAPVAIALHDALGRILETNRAYQRMVGYSGHELRRLGVKRITWPEDVSEGDRLYRELLEGKRDYYYREKRFRSKDGVEIWANSHASAVRDADGRLRYIISLVEDITDRRRAQKQLREMAAIVESSSDAILSTTPDGLIASWNQAAERIYGYTDREAIRQPIIMLVQPDRADELLQILTDVGEGNRIENFETVLRRKDGSLAEISLTISPILDGAGRVTGASAIGRDIGPRKQLEREILESGDNERRRIGHDLHDGLGQILAGIALKTQALQESLVAEESSQAQESGDIVRLVNDSIRQTRTLARGLDPVDAEANGLPAALQTLAVQTEYLFRVQCNYETSTNRLAVDAPTGMALYRIAQEAIHNAVTHGHASQIDLKLEEIGKELRLRIRDNGKGFDAVAKAGSGMGLRIMKYRANSVGGRLSLHSPDGKGTEVECVVSRQLPVAEIKEFVSK